MTNRRRNEAEHHRKWVLATCAGLILAAVGDAGPEIIESRSLMAGYDGPGPLVYLAFAVVIVTVRWHLAPLLAVAMAAFFLLGGFSDADFADRLVSPAEGADFVGAWLQMLSFAAVIVCGTAAVRRRAVRSPVSTRHQ